MKKALVLVLAAALAVGMLAVAGCGDTDKAREYMQKGDELAKEVRVFTGESLTDAGSLLAALGIEYASTGTVEAKTLTNEGTAQINRLISASEAAITEYKKILELDGVEQYEKYATLQIEALEGTIEVLESLKGLLDDIANAPEGTAVSTVLTDWAKTNAGVLITMVRVYKASNDADNVKKEIAAEEK